MSTSDISSFFKQLPADVKNVLKEYDKTIIENRFFKNKEYLLNHSSTKQIKFDKNRWEFCPHIFCLDNYGEDYQYLYPVILTVNTIKSMFEFIQDNFNDLLIYKPSLDSIRTVLTRS